LLGKFGECCVNFSLGTGIQDDEIDAQSLRGLLRVLYLRLETRTRWIGKEADRCGSRHQFAEQLKPFCTEFVEQKTHASHIPTWLAETGHETELDRVAAAREHDRYRGCCCLGGHDRRRSAGKDRTHAATDQISR